MKDWALDIHNPVGTESSIPAPRNSEMNFVIRINSPVVTIWDERTRSVGQ